MLAAGESVPTPESRSKQPVVARKRPHGDRREVRGESGRTVCGQGVEAEFQSQWPWAARCAGDVDSCRDRGAPSAVRNDDVQTPSMLSMLRFRRLAWYVVGGADLSPFFAYSVEPCTMLVWADVDWSRLERRRNDVQINVRWCAAGESWD